MPLLPESATVPVRTLPQVTGGLRLQQGVPRYQRSAATSPPSYCFICGAVLPPWRASCFMHDERQGRGLPSPMRLLPLAGAPPYLPLDSAMGTNVIAKMSSKKPPMKNQLPRWPKFSVKPIPERRSTNSAGSLGL
jgi:hypothetical protein